MKSKLLLLLLLSQVTIISKTFSQNIAINAAGNLPDTSAMLDVSSNIKGFLAPRMTTTEQNAIPLPAKGLLIYNLTDDAFKVNTGTTLLPIWTTIATGSSAGAGWGLTGNSGTTASTNFIGTTDNKDFVTKTNGTEKMRVTSTGNIGIGTSSPTTILSLSGDSGQTIGMERSTSPSGNGSNLTIMAGGAPSSKGNRSGGDLILSSGIVTGNSTSDILFQTTSSGSSGNADNSPTTKMTISGNGNVGINNLAPGSTLDVKGTLRLSGATSGYVGLQPAAAAGSAIYTLPSADGISGQALTTNGSGTLSWTAAGSSSIALLVAASRTSTYTSNTAYATLAYNTVVTNVGTVYNTSTGIFTAPATGLYQIIVSNTYSGASSPSNNTLKVRIIVNGATETELSGALTPYSGTTIYETIQGNTVVQMTSGQTASIQCGGLINTMSPAVGAGQHLLKIIRLN